LGRSAQFYRRSSVSIDSHSTELVAAVLLRQPVTTAKRRDRRDLLLWVPAVYGVGVSPDYVHTTEQTSRTSAVTAVYVVTAAGLSWLP
jgi:hypothetical protein